MTSAASLTIRAGARALSAVLGHAARAGPCEACGALLGTVAPLAIIDAIAVENGADDPLRRYAIPAARVRTLGRQAAVRGLDVVGFYHSHPGGRAEPSQADLEAAHPGYVYVIVGRAGQDVVVRAWRLAENRERFEEAALVPGTAT